MSSVILAEHIAIISAGQTAKDSSISSQDVAASHSRRVWPYALRSQHRLHSGNPVIMRRSRRYHSVWTWIKIHDARRSPDQRNSGTWRGFRRHFRGHSCPRIICDHSDYLGDRRTRGSPSR